MKLLWFLAAGVAFAQPASLNLSHDLSALGIAAQDMAPDTPALDARPLFEAGVQYAQANSIPLVTCDPGTYYLLTGHPFGAYAAFTALHDITVDLAGSDFYFAQATWVGLQCNNCQNVQFLNFTIDSQQLPFTQIQVTSVDTVNHKIGYSAIPGWEPATNFNTPRNQAGTPEPLYAFDFRNGYPVRATSRMPIQKPIDPAFLTVVSDGAPWSDLTQLANINAGDIIALTARIAGPTVRFQGGSNITIQNVAVYSSGQVGLQVNGAPNSTIEQVQIIPRPGTDRLMSSNADGISLIQLGANNVIRRCRVMRTADDGMSPNSQELGVVTGQPAASQVNVNRSAYSTFPNGLAVQFIDNKTGFPAVTAHIVSQDPPYSTATPTFGGAATLTFDQTIPTLAMNDPMVYADPANRGSGLVLENNLVEDLLFARGMSIWGIMGGTVRGNVLRNIPWSSINPVQHLSIRDWMDGPTVNLDIHRNVLDQFNTAFGGSHSDARGGIEAESSDLNQLGIASGSPSQNITIENNFLATSPYSGIRVQNVNGGAITGNTLLNVSAQPSANNPAAALLPQLSQPIVVTASSGITSTPNSVDSNANIASVASAASLSPDAIAPGSQARVLANIIPFQRASDGPTSFTLTITDSVGSLFTVTPSAGLSFVVPAGCAPGAAVFTLSSGSTTLTQAGALIDSLAPALYSVDGSGTGTALGSTVLVHAADGSQITGDLTQPVDLGQPGDSLTVTLYATGVRNVDSAGDVTVFLGGQRLPVQSVGPEGNTDGLDIITFTIPQQLQGAGQLPLRVVAGGLGSNFVTVAIQ